MAKYTIFGAGPGGLYTAWRLATSEKLQPDDSIELYEWGNYSFEPGDGGTRRPAGRICTHHYRNRPGNSYIEVGGMRFLQWDPAKQAGHQLVSLTIEKLGLDGDVVPFLTTDNPLLYLRGKNLYSEELQHGSAVAPYNTGAAKHPAVQLFADISRLVIGSQELTTRAEQCRFYANGTLPSETNSFVYRAGDVASNVGYWNFFYDQAGNEGYQFAEDAGGYSSNTINWNAANAAVYNGEFAPGGAFKTLKTGYSALFTTLFHKAKAAALSRGISFELTQHKRLHSIWSSSGRPTYRLADAQSPDLGGEPATTDYAFLAMPPHAVELVARATRYAGLGGTEDFLNTTAVRNYLDSVAQQPSFKVAMFFDSPWWEKAKYPPKLVSSQGNTNIFGPTITDLPLRQVYYFGNNASAGEGPPVYALLASYDDMRFTDFWRQMDLAIDQRRTTPLSTNLQPLHGPQRAPVKTERMLLLELAKVHYNDPDAARDIPAPLETVLMDWGLSPFGAGYHAWRPHYDICDVMQKIRTPAQLGGTANNVFLIGSAFSNDQAWVEGAFCTAESVLQDYLGIPSIAETTHYPLICGHCN